MITEELVLLRDFGLLEHSLFLETVNTFYELNDKKIISIKDYSWQYDDSNYIDKEGKHNLVVKHPYSNVGIEYKLHYKKNNIWVATKTVEVKEK